MARRFESYAVERGANLADPEYWNRRFEDIDLRLHARELDAATLQAAVETFQSLALARVNDTLTPILQDALTRLSSVGALFEADSISPVPVGTGARTLQLLDAQRAAWVVTSHVVLRSRGSGAAMVAEVLAYDRTSGLLTVDVLSAVGAGTHADWTIRLSAPPDIEHAGRTDNPHQTTAGQVGAYTAGEVDAAIASAIGALSAGVATALAGKQPLAANLTAFAGLSGTANGLPYFSGTGALALATLTAAARTLLAAADPAGQRQALNLGAMALLGLATPEQAAAGLADDVGMTPFKTAQAIEALSPPQTSWWESAEQVITAGGLVTLAHGLGARPRLVYLELVCQAANSGFAVGDRAQIGSNANTGNNNSQGVVAWMDAANVYVRIGSSGIALLTGSGGASSTITLTSWKLVVRAAR